MNFSQHLGMATCIAVAAASGVQAQPQRPQAVAQKPAPPADDAASAAIDGALTRWSSTWMFDRYLRGSARIGERAFVKDVYLVRGQFVFDRMGRRFAIPYAASFVEHGGGHRFALLCYEDRSSGMKDCVDPGEGIAERQASAAASRQFLGAIAVLGLAAALGGGDGSEAPERQRFCRKAYSYGTPGMLGYEDDGQGRRGIPYQECD